MHAEPQAWIVPDNADEWSHQVHWNWSHLGSEAHKHFAVFWPQCTHKNHTAVTLFTSRHFRTLPSNAQCNFILVDQARVAQNVD